MATSAASNKNSSELPKYVDYYVAIVHSLRRFGGSGTNKEIEDAVSEALNISDTALKIPQPGDSRTKFRYQLAWARTHLRSRGIIENVSSGRWRLIADDVGDEQLRQLDGALNEQSPSVPAQGPGPKFKVERGQLAFATPGQGRGSDTARLAALHPVIAQAADSLVRSLEKEAGLVAAP